MSKATYEKWFVNVMLCLNIMFMELDRIISDHSVEGMYDEKQLLVWCNVLTYY